MIQITTFHDYLSISVITEDTHSYREITPESDVSWVVDLNTAVVMLA